MNPQEMRAQRLRDDMLTLSGALDANKAELLNQVQEEVFVTHFLPMFAGNIEDVTEANLRQSQWNTLAGTLVSEVRIVNTLGEELFRVPAMASTQIFDIAKKDNLSIDDIVTMAARLENQSPIRAQEYRFQNYSDKVKSMYDPTNKRAEEVKRWNEIFTRYNVKPKLTGTAAGAAAPPVDPTKKVFTDADEIGEE